MNKAAKKKQRSFKVESIEARYKIGNLKTNAVAIEVDNPMFSRDHAEGAGNRKRATAFMNMTESLASHWWSKKLIDEAQYKAASDFRYYWERAGGSGASGMDYSDVVVDGGLRADPISVTQLEAVQTLDAIRVCLGLEGFDIVQKLCGECVALKDAYPTRHQQIKKSNYCRELLNVLSVYLGYKTTGINAQRA